MVLDQIEAELEKRKLENEGGCRLGVGGCWSPPSPPAPAQFQTLNPQGPRGPPDWLGSGAMESDRPKFKS